MTMALPVVKSCTNCPSFVRTEDVPGMFSSSTGAPMCARFGKVLGRPKLDEKQNETLRMGIASSCASFGQPRMNGTAAGTEKTEVMIADPKVMMNPPHRADKNHIACTNCQGCQNFIPADVVQKELGWTSGACAAKGKLIMMSTVRQNAKNCDYRLFGSNRRHLTDMPLFPEYEDAFALASDPFKKFFAEKAAGRVEPQDYETDAPVSPEDQKDGIRAWRRIVDMEDSSRHVFLPIFDIDSIPVDDRVKIPRAGDDEHPEMYIDHGNLVYAVTALWTELDETPAAWGEPGVGKTELFRHLAYLMQLPFVRLSITHSSEIDDLAGKSTYSADEGTSFKYGRVPDAWLSKCVMCVDEPNTGPADVFQFFRPLFDNSKQLALDMNEGEILDRNAHCFVGLAMNPDWDPRNRGTHPLADADGSRLMHLWVPMPPEELEKEIIRARVALDGWDIDDKRMKSIMSIAADLRRLSKDGEISISWGIRSQIKVARAFRWFGIVDAYRRASADYLEPAQQDILLDIVRSHKAD